jgi:hypothetical protein
MGREFNISGWKNKEASKAREGENETIKRLSKGFLAQSEQICLNRERSGRENGKEHNGANIPEGLAISFADHVDAYNINSRGFENWRRRGFEHSKLFLPPLWNFLLHLSADLSWRYSLKGTTLHSLWPPLPSFDYVRISSFKLKFTEYTISTFFDGFWEGSNWTFWRAVWW